MAEARYLFVRLSALGDVLFALEGLALLKAARPEARVDWLVEDRAAALLEGHPWIDRLLVYPRRAFDRRLRRPWTWPSLPALALRHLRALRARRYDAVLDFQGNLKSAVHLRLARTGRRLGFGPPIAREGSWRVLDEALRWEGPLPHRARQARRLVETLCPPPHPSPPEGPLLFVREEAREAARAFLDGLPGEGPLVVLAPGTSAFAAFKRWPSERFALLADICAREGWRAVVSTGPGEEALHREIAARSRTQLPHWDGARLGLPATLALLERAAAVVAADSGPLHMAQALGRPAVALFGPKDPARYGPWRGRAIVLRHPVPCAPCGLRACPAPLCVRGIPPEAVRDALREWLFGEAAAHAS